MKTNRRRPKLVARVALALILIASGMLALPRPVSRLVAPDATAQPTPTLPDILGSPTPTRSPSGGGGEEESEEGGGGGGGSGGGGEGGGSGSGGGKGKEGDKDGRKGDKKKDGKSPLEGPDKNRKKKRNKKKEVAPPGSIAGRIPGAFDTNELVAVAARLRSLGWTKEEVIRRVYPPFLIAGPASWVDTWGAPRYGPGPIIRRHEGQDVFCNYGDPVLAPEDGIVDFSNGGLGGITARVHVPSTGRYWYLTHLSDVNTEGFSVGDRVETGDVIGYCGNSGNAATTPPHVHFGWYAEGGVNARNPMRYLIAWLHEAERRVLGVVTRTTQKRIEQRPTLTAEHRFGDAFTPDLSELRIAGESLWASGSNPTSGTFALAESALQAALSGASVGFDGRTPIDAIGAGAYATPVEGALDPNSALAQLLGSTDSLPEGAD